MASIYDHPLYYDVLFGWDRSHEASFYHGALLHHGATLDRGLLSRVGPDRGRISLFDLRPTEALPAEGRAMVALRRDD